MEVWKYIKGFEGYYEVSTLGRVKSVERFVKSGNGAKRLIREKILKPMLDKDGYLRVNLKKQQKGKTVNIHRLVASSFIENPEKKPQVNHKNGIKNDNSLHNLEWVTLSENRQHAYDTGLQNGESRRGVKNNFSKLTLKDVKNIREMYIPYKVTNKMIAKKYNVTDSCISAITRKSSWSWV